MHFELPFLNTCPLSSEKCHNVKTPKTWVFKGTKVLNDSWTCSVEFHAK